MSQATVKRRRKAHHEEEHENEERWLVSFADMMTLLFCLFMVLFAISSVNTSKLESLQRSLQEAFSGAVLSGGSKMMESGANDDSQSGATAGSPLATTPAAQTTATSSDAAAAAQEQEQLQALKRRVDTAAAQLGIKQAVDTAVGERGLVVRLRTDGMFFASGSAELNPQAMPVLRRLAQLIGEERKHPVVVEGYTDSTPIASRQYPSNWELSAARASSVLRSLMGGGLQMDRDVTVRGFAERHAAATNTTAAGRAENRRVEIVLTRLYRRSP